MVESQTALQPNKGTKQVWLWFIIFPVASSTGRGFRGRDINSTVVDDVKMLSSASNKTILAVNTLHIINRYSVGYHLDCNDVSENPAFSPLFTQTPLNNTDAHRPHDRHYTRLTKPDTMLSLPKAGRCTCWSVCILRPTILKALLLGLW